MTVHCYEPGHRSGFLPPGTKHHRLCSPGSDVPPETFELRHQIRVSYSRSAATVRMQPELLRRRRTLRRLLQGRAAGAGS